MTIYHAQQFYDYNLCTKLVIFLLVDLADIYGRYGWNIIIFDTGQKKCTKKCKSRFLLKIVWKSKNSIFYQNPDISYPFYPLYPFWKKCDKKTHFSLPPPILMAKIILPSVKKVPFYKILTNRLPEVHFYIFWD